MDGRRPKFSAQSVRMRGHGCRSRSSSSAQVSRCFCPEATAGACYRKIRPSREASAGACVGRRRGRALPAGPLASRWASGGQARRFERAVEQRMRPGFFVTRPGCCRHGSMNRGRDPSQQAVGRRDVIRDQVLHGLGGVIEVVAATLVVVVPLVLPVQLEMRKVRDSTHHRPGAGQCQRLPKHGKQQNHGESGTAHGSSLIDVRCPGRSCPGRSLAEQARYIRPSRQLAGHR